jgi:hypothetical protein
MQSGEWVLLPTLLHGCEHKLDNPSVRREQK